MSISDSALDAGKRLVAATPANFTYTLNVVLNEFLHWPFQAASGFAGDSHGERTDSFGTVVYVASQPTIPTEPVSIDADLLASVFDAVETIDVGQLRDAYERVARAKRLSKSPAPAVGSVPHSTVTLGIILARETTVPLEILAEELDRLNQQHPDREWTDMVVVLSKGTINYAVQFPGGKVEGDFLPPAVDATSDRVPSMYIVTVVRPTEDYTFNRMCAFLLGHLVFFSPGFTVPDWVKLVEDVPKQVMTMAGYQYNLKGQLVPVPREFWNDRYIPQRPFRIEDRKGQLLSTVQFLPWQDGGVLLLRGKLPLETFLVFLGKEAMKRAAFFPRPPDIKISYVLPITRADFVEMLKKLQQQSNLVVRSDPTQFVVQKFLDEGSSSPFVARIFMGTLRLRDAVFPDYAQREQFDKAYEFVSMNLLNVRAASKKIDEIYNEHARKVSAGEIARMQGHNIQVDETVNKELRKEFETFLNLSVRVLKHGMQDVTNALHVSIGFLFKDSKAFQQGATKLQRTDPLLAGYLLETRRWSERLVETRNAVEHKGWTLPQVKYSQTTSGIRAEEPQVSGQPVCQFAEFMTDRVICFVEEVMAQCLQLKLPAGICITEVPQAQREKEIPERFRLTLTNGGMPIWEIKYHDTAFGEV